MVKKNHRSCTFKLLCGCSSAVEHHVANVRVVSSNLITRYNFIGKTEPLV